MTVVEGNTGTVSADFTLSLSEPSALTVTAVWGVGFGTASTNDYEQRAETTVFSPGDTAKVISILVKGDLTDEPEETFLFHLYKGREVNATIVDTDGLGTLLDDDVAPGISIDDVTLAETDAGTTSALFTVVLSADSGQAVSVDFATADGTAQGGSDYTPLTGTLSFSPGTTTQTLAVAVNGDLSFEADETFSVQLANPANAILADAQGQGLIQNDDDESLALAPMTGTWDVTFGKSNQVHSEVFSGGDLRLNEGSKSQPGLLEGSVKAVGDVRIEAHNHLTGSVTAGGQVKLPAKKQAGTVQLDGTISKHASVTPVVLPPLSFAVNSSGAAKVNLKKREARDLAPYEQTGLPYGELKAEQHATLTLHSGTYYFQRFTLGHHCELILELQGGPVTINIKEGMHLGHYVRVTLRGGDAGQVLFNVAGPGLAEEEGEEDEDRDEWVPQDRQGRRDFAPALAVRILKYSVRRHPLCAPGQNTGRAPQSGDRCFVGPSGTPAPAGGLHRPGGPPSGAVGPSSAGQARGLGRTAQGIRPGAQLSQPLQPLHHPALCLERPVPGAPNDLQCAGTTAAGHSGRGPGGGQLYGGVGRAGPARAAGRGWGLFLPAGDRCRGADAEDGPGQVEAPGQLPASGKVPA